MKRFALSVLAALTAALVASCGGSAPVKNEPVVVAASSATPLVTVQVIRQSETPTPQWVNKKWEVVKEDPASGLPKMIYLAVEATGNDQEKAMYQADANHIARLTELFKAVATREFAVAKQGMLNDTAPLDAYMEETIAVLSKNVDISGIPQKDVYWSEEMEKDNSTGATKRYVRYVIRYAMEFSLYTKAINRSVEQAAKKVNPELQNKAQNTLAALNAASDKMEGQGE